MADLIGRWFVCVRAYFAPRPPGRHSRAYQPPAAPVQPYGVLRKYRGVAATTDGELVRPYFLAHEQRQESQRQRRRRRVLVLATMGIDLGPRVIHGVEVGR
jgi:hypothetical protein